MKPAKENAASPAPRPAAQNSRLRLSPKNNDALPKTQAPEADPLVGWFSLGRNVKRTWKKGGAR